ncbi:hypothetical protein GOP47_0000492 [Adiantum capillus-veneris]|uniref:RING-type E3 ubiquitin transferase n=1 Tax=Adiantum capillus-veneris TaxID=13818 RepID=A0A9D4ZQS2_ADICA|nr:hypothetical protein GOP47_0000492 [Adiantum capillus-veneris]
MEVIEEHEVFILAERKMYEEMCRKLALLVQKILDVFPTLEALQPEKSGMQALCEVQWAVDRAKSFLQRVVNSSTLYLAITSDSVASKFEKVKECLDQSLRRLEANVPDDLAQQVALCIAGLQEMTFESDASDEEAGKEIVSLLQKEKEDPGFNAETELEVFDLVMVKLGIKSDKAVSAEKRALRRLLHRTRKEEDKKKELIVLYLLHLLRKYSKVYKLAILEEGSAAEATSSCPPSPSERGSEASTSGRDSDYSSELCFFEFYPRRAGNGLKEGLSCLRHSFIPPEEFRCPISLQLMSDPVIISSGQTYERVCIEKWFEEGHDTCPKTQQKLAHLDVTPNYCVKGLIMSWCERHSIPIPTPPSPPPSPVTSWNCTSFSDSLPVKPCVSVSQSDLTLSPPSNTMVTMSPRLDPQGINKCPARDLPSDLRGGRLMERLDEYARVLCKPSETIRASARFQQLKAAEEIRHLSKDNADARLYIGEAGLIPALVDFLGAAVKSEDEDAQETSCLALLNVAINNNRNKAEIVSAGAVSILLRILGLESSLAVREAAIAVFLTVSCLDENKPAIGSSGVVSHLVGHLDTGSTQGVKDALTTLFNLSIFAGNHTCLLKDGTIPKLFNLLNLGDVELMEKCITVLYNLMSIEEAHKVIAETDGYVSTLAEVLDSGSQKEKELIVGIFLALCSNSHDYTQLVLREGVIPSLVMLSVNGSARGKDKAQKLLQHFREERQKDCLWNDASLAPSSPESLSSRDLQGKSDKGFFKKKPGSGISFGFFRKSKSFSFYHC